MNFLSRIKRVLFCRRELIIELKNQIDLVAFRKEWRLQNIDNGTTAKNKFNKSIVSVGEGTYGALSVIGFGNPKEGLSIGRYCSIAGDVTFLLGGEHCVGRITTYPYEHHILKRDESGYTPTKGPIIIEDDVWICHGATILSGVRIGKGAVIGARAIISKDVPPYAIVVGDGIIKRYRFSSDISNIVKKVDLSRIKEMDKEKQDYLMKNIVDDSNIVLIKEWFDIV